MIKKFDGDYAFLSNFHLHPVEFEGDIYPSTEHAFQAAKTANQEHRRIIRDKDTPGKAKRAGGRRGIVVLRTDWEEVKLDIMYDLNFKKFQNPALQALLLATGEEELQEGNNWNDTYWGVSLKTGKGTNYLGIILMDIRDDVVTDDWLQHDNLTCTCQKCTSYRSKNADRPC